MQTVKSLKVHVLDLGTIEYDAGFALAGAGVSSRSEPNPASPRRHASIIGALIEHPTVGPIPHDTGIAPNYEELWAPVLNPTLIFGHDPGVLADLRWERFWD